jgi:hypothetical protein
MQILLSSLQSALTSGFMVDITVGGHVDVVANDVQHICSFGATLGLNVNTTKCELIVRIRMRTMVARQPTY